MIEARVPLLRAAGRVGVHHAQVAQHGLHGGVERVQIEAVESHTRVGGNPVVVGPQPADEIQDVGVAPHPVWKPLEPAQGLGRIAIVPGAPDVPVYAVGGGPVGLHRHRREAALADQSLGDFGPEAVELVCAVRRLPDQREAGVPDPREQRVEVLGTPSERVGGLANPVG